MSKNDYWSEKENEKYEKFKVALQNNELNLSEAKKFSNKTNRIIKIICIPAIIIGVLTLIIVILYLILLWVNLKNRVDPDICKYIEDLYGEKFVIMSEKIDGKEEIYKVSPKSNKKIVFTAYKKGATIRNDYQSQAYKYLVEEILDENIRSKLTIENNITEQNGVKLEDYKAYLEPNTFEQIEEYTEIMKKIREQALEQKKRVYNFITSPSFIKIGNYYSNVQYSKDYSKNDFKKKEKYGYINYLKENNLRTEDVPKEELDKYKPLYLKIFINGEDAETKMEFNSQDFATAEYDEITDEYQLPIFFVLDLVGNAPDDVTTKCPISYIENNFDAKIKYDYKNKNVYIEI